MRDYTGSKVYLGIDVHKKTYAVTAICDGQLVKKDTLAADPLVLVGYCKKYFVGAEIESAYEAGFSGFHLHRILISQNIKNRAALRRSP
jgi:transposase